MRETWVQSLGQEDSPGEGNGNPLFLPGKSHGQRSLVGYSPRGRKESDTTGLLHFHFHFHSWETLWTARRSNQLILKEINPEYSLEGLMMKLKFQYFGHLRWRADSLEKTLMLGKIEGKRRRGWQSIRWLDSITNSLDMSLSKLWEMVKDRSLAFCSPWGHKELTQLSNWTTTNSNHCPLKIIF